MKLKRFRIIGISLLALGFGLWAPGNSQTQSSNDKIDEETLAKLELFADIFTKVRDNYVENTDDKDLIESALNGALSALDPHSSFTPAEAFIEQQKVTRREYGGLGIEITQEDGLIRINYTNEDSPAQKSGLKEGDFITAVNGESVLNKTFDDAIAGMRGLVGDPVTLTIKSEGRAPRDVVLIRAVINGRLIRPRLIDDIGYLYIETFNSPNLANNLRKEIMELQSEASGKLSGIILDLRSNRGGLLDQSVDVASLFLSGGEVLSARGRDANDTQRYNAEDGELIPGIPLAVMINSGSASAAEIVAGAIQDRGRGIVVGRRSFGKGSVQSVIHLPSDHGVLRLTTQKYYTPSGRSIQGQGVLPDVLVAIRPDTGEIIERFREDSLPNALSNQDSGEDYQEKHDEVDYPPEDWDETEDYQLDKTVEILKSETYNKIIAAYNLR